MKDCFERYRRSGPIPPHPTALPSQARFPQGSVSHSPVCRKRALRRVPGSRHEADWEPSTGSDNTDTEGS